MASLLALVSPLRWWRLARMERAQRGLLVEAGFRLSRAAIAVRFLPFERAIRSGAGPLGTGQSCEIEAVVRSIRGAAASAPFRAVCLQQGIACQAMLRARGVDATLYYGLSSAGEQMEAHVWVAVDGRIVIGEEEAARFQPVAAFPA